MGKIINLSAVLEKEEKLQQVVDYMEELKDQFSYLIQEYILAPVGAGHRELIELRETCTGAVTG